MVWYFVNNIWSTFYFRHMSQCRSGVTFLSLTTSVWSYHYRNGDGVYLGDNTCRSALLGFTLYTLYSLIMHTIHKIRTNNDSIWFELWSNLWHLFKKIWNADKLRVEQTARAAIIPYDREQNWNKQFTATIHTERQMARNTSRWLPCPGKN